MVKINDLIEEFKLNQQIQGRKDKYMELTTYRLNRWLTFMEEEYGGNKSRRCDTATY